MTEVQVKTAGYITAPWIIIKQPSEVEKMMLERFSKGDFFLHIVGPNTPKLAYVAARLWGLFKNGLKVYIPAHLVILLLRLRGKKDSKSTLLKKYLIGVLRSTLFVTVMASCIPVARVTPLLYNIFSNKTRSWAGFFISFMFSCAIFIDSSSRWSDVSLYVLGQWIEAFPGSLVKRRYVPQIPQADKYLMGLTIGMLSWLTYSKTMSSVQDDEKKRKNKVAQAVEFLIGTFDDEKQNGKSQEKCQQPAVDLAEEDDN